MTIARSGGASDATPASATELVRGREGDPPQLDVELMRERRARSEAEHALRIRDEMLALVVHDLRNPLNTISLASQLLLAGGVDARALRAHVQTIERCARGMSHLIDDLLDVSTIEAGVFHVRREPVAVGVLLARLRSDFAVRAADAEVSLRCRTGNDLPGIRGDNERLYQVLSNLVGNALKVVPAGGTIEVEARRKGKQIEVIVRDDGPGMQPEVLEHAFDRFWHADHAGRAGSGLGLYICKGIIEAHGGRIDVDSAPGAGTAFRVLLPLPIPVESGCG